MPRTFSLATLLLAITIVCLLCGLAVNFPQVTLLCAMTGLFFLPTVLVWLVLICFSPHRGALAFTSFAGAFCGCLTGAPLIAIGLNGLHNSIVNWMIAWVAMPLVPALGALIFSAALLILEQYILRHESHLRRRDS